MKILLIYHQYCRDGYAAMAVTFKYYLDQYKQKNISNVDLIYKGIDPGQLNADKLIFDYPSDTIVISYDLAINYRVFKKMSNHFTNLNIWDHHVSTKQNCIDLIQPDEEELKDKIHYIQEYCAAVIAWNNYYPDQPVPIFLLYIQDRDLWTNTQPNSKNINAGLFEALPLEYVVKSEVLNYIKEYSSETNPTLNILIASGDNNVPYFKNWIKYMLNDNWIDKIKTNGELVVSIQNRSINQSCQSAKIINLNGKKVYLVNVTDQYISDVSNILYNRCDNNNNYLCEYVLAWRFNHRSNLIYVSLRSKQDIGLDVSKLAIILGGGGHKHAAGFECTFQEFYNKIVRKIY